MLGHYWLVTWRNLRARPVISLLNVLTLALGLSCFVFAYALTTFWNSSDRHFANAERTYIVSTAMSFRDGRADMGSIPRVNDHLAEYLRVDYPSLEAVARLAFIDQNAMVSAGGRVSRAYAATADAEFLRIFDLPFLLGNPVEALNQPRSVVVSQELAQNLFGDETPLGQPLLLQNSVDTTITGVIAAIPEPSHMGRSASAPVRFDLLASRDVFDALQEIGRPPEAPPPPENWLYAATITYVLFPEDGSITPVALMGQLDRFAAAHIPLAQHEFAELEFGLEPMTTLLNLSGLGAGFLRGGALSKAGALLLLGSLVLVVGGINYANVATSVALGGARAIAVRTVVGARARQIAAQHLLEAAALTAVASILAFGLLLAVAPMVRASAQIDLTAIVLSSGTYWLGFLGVIVAVSIAAGTYPAVILSRVRPIVSLHGPARRLRHGLSGVLVGLQFFAASFLLIAVAIILLQNEALKRIGFGVTTEPLLAVSNPSNTTHIEAETLRTELLTIPGVSAVTDMQPLPWSGYMEMSLSTSPEATAAERNTILRYVGYDFFSTFQMTVLAGRAFDPARVENTSEWGKPENPMSIVVDRSFVEEFGYESPQDAVEQLVYVSRKLMQAFAGGTVQPLRIIGVVDDKALSWRTTGPRSTIFMLGSDLPFQVARISTADLTGTLDRIDETWHRLGPDIALERRFIDDIFDTRYENFRRMSGVFLGLAAFAILISAMGLLGMAILSTRRRLPEIAIRKTMGASTRQIVFLLMREFSSPVIVANLAAWPLAYLAARAYLRFFVVPIDLTALPFVAAFAMTLLLAWVTVAGQTWRAARAAPATVLRDV
jgi:putative ABC transport system permease protein